MIGRVQSKTVESRRGIETILDAEPEDISAHALGQHTKSLINAQSNHSTSNLTIYYPDDHLAFCGQ